MSHESSVSIVTQAICTGNLKSLFETVLAYYLKHSNLSRLP